MKHTENWKCPFNKLELDDEIVSKIVKKVRTDNWYIGDLLICSCKNCNKAYDILRGVPENERLPY